MTDQAKSMTREEQAKLEVGHTDMSCYAKWTLFLAGLFTLFAIPVVQTCLETYEYANGKRERPWPRSFEIFDAVGQAATAARDYDGNILSKIGRSNTELLRAIDKYEKDLTAQSVLTKVVLPLTQEMLAHVGAGNEKAYVGRQLCLFYRPGIDYCTGPGFLDPRQLRRRAEGRVEWQAAPQPDPRAAILQFQRQLAERNIRLVLMPVPGKATLHPEKFSSRYDKGWMTIHNPSYVPFLDELRDEGVLICDVADALGKYRERSGNAVYLATDTHWTPEAVELAVAELARLIEAEIPLDATTAIRYVHLPPEEIENLGDIAMMLKMRRNQSIVSEEVATIRPVSDVGGQPWQPDSSAEVLVLGDSFANIYSLEMMNWGRGAGFAEQLSIALNHPVDAILRNDDGAFATREMLSRELSQGNDRLAGKRVVIWQFAARELAVGNWKLLDMTLKQSSKPADESPLASSEVIVSGTIAAKSAAPRAGQIPYADHIFTLDLTDLQVHRGILNEPKVAVYLFSMRNYQNTPAYSWPIGKRVKLKLQPWHAGFYARYGRINRTETKARELAHPWWGEAIE
jgi:alginate O-acetyltransferase complex protein AlgJ